MTTSDRVQVEHSALIGLQRAGAALPLRAGNIAGRMAGNHGSRFKGRGMEFDEARPYQPGDDARNLDWRVTARTGKPFTKLFREERERSVLLWVDNRAPMHFATRGCFKSVLAARAAALLAWGASHHGDRLGGLLFSESNHIELRPRRGKHAVLNLIRELAGQAAHPDAETTDEARQSAASHALARLRRVARPGSLLFLLSDFRSLGKNAEAHLTQLARHNDIVLFFLHDPLEKRLPPPGRYRIGDGRRRITIDTTDPALQRRYRQRFQAHEAWLRTLCHGAGIRLLHCATDQDPQAVLQEGLGGRRQ